MSPRAEQAPTLFGRHFNRAIVWGALEHDLVAWLNF